MSLTEKVTFTATLQGANAVQIPKLVRWRFKLESSQALKVGVNFSDLHRDWQFFYAKMRKDGRITVPNLVLNLFGSEQESLAGYVLEVMLEPA
jgi:hypothetical protein